MLSYTLRDLYRNARRTFASIVGVALGVGLFASIIFFVDVSVSSMTQRAIAPVLIDMQISMSTPLASQINLKETVAGPASLAPGQTATITLTATNEGARPTNDVIIKDEPSPPLTYVPGTTTLNGRLLPDPEDRGPQISAGLPVGPLPPRATATVTYQVRASSPIAALARLPFHGVANSREYAVLANANAPTPIRQENLEAELSRLPGVTRVDRLSMVDLPAGSLRMGASQVIRPVRVFAFDPAYVDNYPNILVTNGSFVPGRSLLSVEAARQLSVNPGGSVQLFVPGRLQPIPLAVGGLVDMSQATTLFASRAPETVGDFIYLPDAVVVPPDLFDDLILPALRQDAVSTTPLLVPPVIELDVMTDRAQLNANPSLAFTRARGLRRSIERVAPGQALVIDNLSNALNLAKSDAIVAKVMFLFLGLPGVLLAAFLAGYAGSLLAQAQRREMAILRGHGAQQRHLMRALAYKTVAVAILGSLMGLGIALLALAAVLGRASLMNASPEDLISSAVAAAGAGAIATAIALYIPGRRSLARETTEERREMEVARPPAWMRLRLDFVLLAVAGAVEVVTFLGGGFSPRQTEGQALALSFYVLLTPMLAWFGAILLGARLVLMGAPRIPGGGSGRFGTLVGGTLRRSLKRRSRNLAAGIIGVGLTLGFGTSAAIFIATYHAEKTADSRFEVGSDLRVTPSALTPQPPSYASQLLVPGAEAASPVVFHAANSALGADKKDMAAIDAPSIERTSHFSDSFFLDTTAAAAMAAMKADPAALLVDWEIAQDYGINTGDGLKVQVTDVFGRESSVNFRVIGRYKNFPGLTQHVDLIANLGFYQTVTGRTSVDFFLVRSKDPSPAAVAALAAAVRSGPGRNNPLLVDTTANALRRDQSSLAALNLNGLGALDSLYTALMSAAAISIFVLGLTLQRRKEYVTMRALGARTLQLQILLVGEAGLVAVGGVVIGGLVGGAMAYMYVQVLRPVFTLPPEQLTLPADQLATLAGLVLGAMGLSALVASGMLRRLKPMELLREE